VQLSDSPNTFVGIKLKYLINGQVNEDKVKKAIHLSEEKYCSVLSTLRLGVNIESNYELLD
jgi:putative redox protein